MTKLFIILLIVTATDSLAFASSTVLISFTALPGTQGNGTANSQGNTYNGEVPATIAGIPDEDLVCDDFDKTTYVPSSQIDFSVATISDLSGVNFANGFATVSGNTLAQTQAYDTAAILLTELEALTVDSQNAQAITDYQYAIWDLMLPNGADGGYKDSPLDANAVSDQQSAFATVQANGAATQAVENALVVYTPTSAYSSDQEFLGMDTPAPSPEPSSWALLAGLGLLLCVLQVRSRLRSLLYSIRSPLCLV